MPTSIPLPKDSYITLLGEIVYSVGYLEWLILGDLRKVPNQPPNINVETLAEKTTWQIGDLLKGAAKTDTHSQAHRKWLAESAKQLIAISKKRNHIIHAKPATKDNGEQCLYRWTARSGKP